MGDGYFAKRRRIKREIVRMNTPWIDKIKDNLFLWFVLAMLVVIFVLVIRGHVNGAW